MKIGIFDSGLGGLIIANSLIKALPEYDYIYFGDLARVPYSNRSQETIFEFTKQAVDYLFRQDCQLIIIACNTASAEALRKIQQSYLPVHYPDRRVLGVLRPTAEEAVIKTSNHKIGVIGTTGTIKSASFVREIHNLSPDIKVYQQATPLLVPLIENDGLKWAEPILEEYLSPLLQAGVDTIILGCTHYPIVKDIIRKQVGPTITVISQDEIIPAKLENYLARHQAVKNLITKTSKYDFLVTDITDSATTMARQMFGEKLDLRLVSLE